MNVNNGNIHSLEEAMEITMETNQKFSDNFLEVSESDMTEKQKATRTVSLKDHTSTLGKKLTHERKVRKIGRNEPCSCGSGLKYKKCCLRWKQ